MQHDGLKQAFEEARLSVLNTEFWHCCGMLVGKADNDLECLDQFVVDRMEFGFTEQVKSLEVLLSPASLFDKQIGAVAKSAFYKLQLSPWPC